MNSIQLREDLPDRIGSLSTPAMLRLMDDQEQDLRDSVQDWLDGLLPSLEKTLGTALETGVFPLTFIPAQGFLDVFVPWAAQTYDLGGQTIEMQVAEAGGAVPPPAVPPGLPAAPEPGDAGRRFVPVDALEYGKQRGELLGKWPRDLDAAVKDVVNDAVEHGFLLKDLMKDLRTEVFPDFSGPRLETIARTETGQILSEGIAVAAKRVNTKNNGFLVAAQFIGLDDARQCFAAGTLISMADGSRKEIQEIEPGEMVVSGCGENRHVLGTKISSAQEWIILETSLGRITCTVTHPFWVRRDRSWQWIEAGEIITSDCIGTRMPAVQRDIYTQQKDISRQEILFPKVLRGIQERKSKEPRKEMSLLSNTVSFETKVLFNELRYTSEGWSEKTWSQWTACRSKVQNRIQLFGLPENIQELDMRESKVLLQKLLLQSERGDLRKDLLSMSQKILSSKRSLETRKWSRDILQQRMLPHGETWRTASRYNNKDVRSLWQENQGSPECSSSKQNGNLSLLEQMPQTTERSTMLSMWQGYEVATMYNKAILQRDMLASFQGRNFYRRNGKRRTGEIGTAVSSRSTHQELVSGFHSLRHAGDRNGRILLAQQAKNFGARCQEDQMHGREWSYCLSFQDWETNSSRTKKISHGVNHDSLPIATSSSEVLAVYRFKEKAQCYDLMIDQDHSYLVNGGHIVHNTTICHSRHGRIILPGSTGASNSKPCLHYSCRSKISYITKYELARLEKGDSATIEAILGWTTFTTLEEAMDWSKVIPPMVGFGGPVEF